MSIATPSSSPPACPGGPCRSLFQLSKDRSRLRCHKEGHQARVCKRPRSPEALGPPPRQVRLGPVVIVNPRHGDVMLAQPSRRPPPHRPSSRSPTPADPSPARTPDGSSSRHILPSSLPIPPEQPRDPSRRPRFELRVIPRTTKIYNVEEVLGNALVAVVGGTRSAVSPS
jgi:hypothetical protein